MCEWDTTRVTTFGHFSSRHKGNRCCSDQISLSYYFKMAGNTHRYTYRELKKKEKWLFCDVKKKKTSRKQDGLGKQTAAETNCHRTLALTVCVCVCVCVANHSPDQLYSYFHCTHQSTHRVPFFFFWVLSIYFLLFEEGTNSRVGIASSCNFGRVISIYVNAARAFHQRSIIRASLPIWNDAARRCTYRTLKTWAADFNSSFSFSSPRAYTDRWSG